MIYKKLPALVLFTLSFIVISLSGYQCATQQYSQQGRGAIPLDTKPKSVSKPVDDDTYPDDYGDKKSNKDEDDDDDGRLPIDSGKRCHNTKLNGLGYGAIASFRFDNSSLQDFLFGESLNFEPICARLYLDMSHIGSPKKYKGSLSLALQTNINIRTFQGFQSGFSAKDNSYNSWSGSSWEGDGNNRVDKTFHAIFEDAHSALILKLERVVIKDVGDGDVAYIGAGEIFYKMFRIATAEDVKTTKDSCYSTGTYVSKAHTPPPRKSNRCWLVNFGPYSCRPEGSLGVTEKFADIDITTNSYKCFSRLGVFWNLDIEEAFNDDVKDI